MVNSDAKVGVGELVPFDGAGGASWSSGRRAPIRARTGDVSKRYIGRMTARKRTLGEFPA
jgi:hypothetical protein